MKPDQATTCATFYSAETFQPEESMGYLMRQILSAIAQQVERQLAHTDLTNAQWVPLLKLYTKQASTVAELARACHLDTGAMTRLLDRLEAKGLCQRVRSEEDRRVVNILLTKVGMQAAAAIPGLLTSVQNAHLKGFTPEEFATLQSFLRRILNNTQATSADTHGDSDAP